MGLNKMLKQGLASENSAMNKAGSTANDENATKAITLADSAEEAAAKKKAENSAKKKAEEAKRKAEEKAKKKAEEEARKKAEEETKKKLEETAKKNKGGRPKKKDADKRRQYTLTLTQTKRDKYMDYLDSDAAENLRIGSFSELAEAAIEEFIKNHSN